jgi:hypothetical protein
VVWWEVEVAWRRGKGDGGGDDDEAESKPVLSFTEALHAFESI